MSEYYDEQPQKTYTLIQVCEACHMDIQVVTEMVSYTIVEPKGSNEETWISDFLRLKKAIRIHQDLKINLAGVAMALELMDDLNHYKKKSSELERLLDKLRHY